MKRTATAQKRQIQELATAVSEDSKRLAGYMLTVEQMQPMLDEAVKWAGSGQAQANPILEPVRRQLFEMKDLVRTTMKSQRTLNKRLLQSGTQIADRRIGDRTILLLNQELKILRHMRTDYLKLAKLLATFLRMIGNKKDAAALENALATYGPALSRTAKT